MAAIGVGKGSYIRAYRNARLRAFPEDSSQTFIVGDPIIMGSDSDEGNYIKIAGTDPDTDRKFVGFAAKAATGTKGTMIDVWLATDDAEFIGHIEGTTAIDNDMISTELGIVADATNLIWRVDSTETTAKVARILELADAHGDTAGRVVFKVITPERLY